MHIGADYGKNIKHVASFAEKLLNGKVGVWNVIRKAPSSLISIILYPVQSDLFPEGLLVKKRF